MFNDFQIVLYGGFAIVFLLFTIVFGGLFIYIHIVGGEISYETEGLIPKIKRLRKTRKKVN